MQEIMMGVGVMNTPEYPIGWTRMNDFPYGDIYYHSAALLGDELYVFGGRLNGSLSNRTFKLHIPSDTWSELQTTNNPTARQHHSLAASNGLLIMYGGSVDGTQCWALNPVTSFWQLRATGRNSSLHRAVTYLNKIVIIGGDGLAAAQMVRFYTPVINTWTTGTAPPFTISAQGMDLFGDEIWMYGGFVNGMDSSAIWSYNLTSNTWTSRDTSPTGRQYHTFSNLKGKGYSYGGFPNPGSDRFKSLTLPNNWTQLTGSPPTLYGHTATTWQDKLLVVGGATFSTGATNEVWLYNPG